MTICHLRSVACAISIVDELRFNENCNSKCFIKTFAITVSCAVSIPHLKNNVQNKIKTVIIFQKVRLAPSIFLDKVNHNCDC